MKNVCQRCCFNIVYLTINSKTFPPNRHPSPSWGETEEIDSVEGPTQKPAVELLNIKMLFVMSLIVILFLIRLFIKLQNWTCFGIINIKEFQVNATLVGVEEDGFTCIKSWWWDKLFLMRVHACEKSCLVHNVKAGVHLSNKQGHEIKDS